jgi:hypothetical protein
VDARPSAHGDGPEVRRISMTNLRIGRRAFTSALGASFVAASFVEAARGAPAVQRAAKKVHPAGAGVAKRLVVFFTPNGTVHKYWRPMGSGENFSFIRGGILEPLAAHAADLVICDGIDFAGFDNHAPGMAGMLTGNGGTGSATRGMSVDQYIATNLTAGTRFDSLEFGVQTSAWGGQVQTRMSYASGGTFVTPEDRPRNAFTRMFGDVTGGNPTELDKLARRKRSILDVVKGDLADLYPRLGREEQIKLEQHLDALRKMENGMTGGGTCTTPLSPGELDPYANDSFPAVGRAQMDLLVTALACGLTRVASIQWAHTVSPTVFRWLGVTEGHHDLSHKDDSNVQGVADFVKAERWHAEQFAYLLTSLAAVPEPGGSGSMLDNTLVLWAKELADGRRHDGKSVPFILAGKAGGYLKTGRYLNFGGAPHQKLLVSICQAMGLTNPTFGDPSHGTGPLDGLST